MCKCSKFLSKRCSKGRSFEPCFRVCPYCPALWAPGPWHQKPSRSTIGILASDLLLMTSRRRPRSRPACRTLSEGLATNNEGNDAKGQLWKTNYTTEQLWVEPRARPRTVCVWLCCHLYIDIGWHKRFTILCKWIRCWLSCLFIVLVYARKLISMMKNQTFTLHTFGCQI